MNSATKSKALSAGAVLALGIVCVVLMSGTPAASKAGAQGGERRATNTALTPKPVIRDHRPKPVVRDHVNGTVTRDHTGGNKPSTASKRRARGTPCLGNLCNVKVCAASVCF